MNLSVSAIESLGESIAVEIDAGGPIPALCARIAAVLEPALASDAFDELFAAHDRSFVAWQDPLRGTIINASIHQLGHRTPAHDHAEAWAVYGAYRGRTAFHTFDRGVDVAPGLATLISVDERVLEPPSIAVILPGQVHENWNAGDELAWNLVVRTRPLDACWRRAFDLTSGSYRTMRRPK
jgi:hypothetical protein